MPAWNPAQAGAKFSKTSANAKVTETEKKTFAFVVETETLMAV